MLGHIISYLTFEELPNFSKAPAQFTCPLAMYDFPYSPQRLLLSFYIIIALLVEWYLVVLHFPNDMSIFSCAFCPFVCLGEISIQILHLIFNWLSFYCLVLSSLYIPVQILMICKHSSHSVGRLFTGCIGYNTKFFI